MKMHAKLGLLSILNFEFTDDLLLNVILQNFGLFSKFNKITNFYFFKIIN